MLLMLYRYIYGGIIDIENMDTKTLFELMIAANKLEFEELSEKLENHLIESKTSWLKTHFTFVHRSIFKYNKFNSFFALGSTNNIARAFNRPHKQK